MKNYTLLVTDQKTGQRTHTVTEAESKAGAANWAWTELGLSDGATVKVVESEQLTTYRFKVVSDEQ